jgi:hypothetical protein
MTDRKLKIERKTRASKPRLIFVACVLLCYLVSILSRGLFSGGIMKFSGKFLSSVCALVLVVSFAPTANGDDIYDQTFQAPTGDPIPHLIVGAAEVLAGGFTAWLTGPFSDPAVAKQADEVRKLQRELEDAKNNIPQVRLDVSLHEQRHVLDEAIKRNARNAVVVNAAVTGSPAEIAAAEKRMERAIQQGILEVHTGHQLITDAVNKSTLVAKAITAEAVAQKALFDGVKELARLQRRNTALRGLKLVRIGAGLFLVAQGVTRGAVYLYGRDPGVAPLYALGSTMLRNHNEGSSGASDESVGGYLDHYRKTKSEVSKRLDAELSGDHQE